MVKKTKRWRQTRHLRRTEKLNLHRRTKPIRTEGVAQSASEEAASRRLFDLVFGGLMRRGQSDTRKR